MSHFKLDFLGYRVVVLSLESHLIPGFQFPHLSETEGNGTECFLRFFSNIMSMILSFEKINGIKVTLLMRRGPSEGRVPPSKDFRVRAFSTSF